MSFIQRELDRVGDALWQLQPNNRYAELYVAQQALMWVRLLESVLAVQRRVGRMLADICAKPSACAQNKVVNSIQNRLPDKL